MNMTMRRTALSLAAATLMIAAPITAPVFAAPVVVDTIAVGLGPWAVAFSPNGKKAYVANFFGDTVSAIKTSTGDVTDTINVGDGPYSLAFSPMGKQVYVAMVNIATVSVIR